MKFSEFNMLNVRLNGLTMTELNEVIKEAIDSLDKRIIANHNLHSIYLCTRNYRMREFYEKAYCTHIDGMPIVWIGKILGYPFLSEHRTTYADWVWSIAKESSEKNWRIFYLGSKPGIADKGAQILREKFPSLMIETNHGYFDASHNSIENRRMIEKVNSFKPNILMVGMSMPRQECWISDNLEDLEVNAILPSGAAIDYVAGSVLTPPRWAGKLGLEWFFRFISEPKRLGYRYLVEPIFLIPLFLKDVFRNLKGRLSVEQLTKP